MTLLKLVMAILLISIFFIPGYAQSSPKTEQSKTATNKQLIKKIFDELINQKNLALFDQYFLPDVIDHSAFPGQMPGREGLRNSVMDLFENYPDIRVKIDEMVAEGDFVVTRDLWSATEKSSGNKKSGWVIHIFKIKDGMITEEWSKGWEWLN